MSIRYSHLISIIVTLGLLLGIGFTWLRPPAATPNNSHQCENSALATATAKIASLKNERDALAYKLTHLNEIMSKTVFKGTTKVSRTLLAVNAMIPDAELTPVFGSSKHLTILEDKLHTEQFDPVWAPHAEQDIFRQFDKIRGAIDGTDILDMQCANTLCRIEVSHENLIAENKFFLAMQGYVDRFAMNQFVMRRINNAERDDGQLHSIFFLARDGYDLTSVIR